MGGLTNGEISTAEGESVEQEWLPKAPERNEPSVGDLVRLKFYSLVTRARNRLVFIRQEGDGDGRQSPVVTVGGCGRGIPAAGTSQTRVGESASDTADEWVADRGVRSGIDVRASAGARVSEDLRFRKTDRSRVASAEGLSALGTERAYSPTEIETYLECPYRWFHERIVQPDDIDPEFDARERGERAHRLLAAFYRHLATEGPQPSVTPEWLARGTGVVR